MASFTASLETRTPNLKGLIQLLKNLFRFLLKLLLNSLLPTLLNCIIVHSHVFLS